MSDQWGPWIEHDGKGCPVVVGVWVMVVDQDNRGICTEIENAITNGPKRSWNWVNSPEFTRVIRYRIRKPRALIEMIERAANLELEGV